jgi:AmmeMemoRadiSam system protein B
MCPTLRPPAVAGSFYPANPDALRAEVLFHLDEADPVNIGFPLRMLIVPHAGFVYSGPVAATGYQLLHGNRRIQRVVMLGPSHYVRFSGLALPGVDGMESPLGVVSIEPTAADHLAESELVVASPEAHAREHSLEVQLPFLQTVMPGIPIVPILTGAVDIEEAAEIIEPLLDESTLLAVSSDLSHYHDAGTARRLDAATAEHIVQLDPDSMGRESACGLTGVQMALHLARRRGYRAEVLDLRNSADTAGSPDRVVGYGTFAFGG